MLLSKMLLIVLFFIFIQDVTGIEKGNPFSDDEHYSSASDGPFRDNEVNISEGDSSGNAMNNNYNSIPDILTNYSDSSFHHELATLTSNEETKITIDVTLLPVIQLVGLENISITGHDNPTVNCDNAGGIYFDNCHNCTIIGITWEKCGTENDNKPAIQLYNSSNIIIQNCSFQHSIARAIALSEMSGKVIVNGCKFLFNYFRKHGTALYYLSDNNHLNAEFQFTITNCNFTHNGMAGDKSIVYIGSSSDKSLGQMYLMNCVFSNNRGVPLYISHQRVVASGNIMFKRNVAETGGAICITNLSKFTFYTSDTIFDHNTAVNHGGALYISDNSNVTFKGNSTVRINKNSANYYGGAFYIKYSFVTFEGNSTVIITYSKASENGGSLYIDTKSDVIFKGNCIITIMNGEANTGGVLYVNRSSTVAFEGNSRITINNNQAERGGALSINKNSKVTFVENSTVTINNNKANIQGGALDISNSQVTFKGNCTVQIYSNLAISGGALSITSYADVIFEGNSTVKIYNNKVDGKGGGFYIIYSNLTFKENSIVMINNNLANKNGGALAFSNKPNVTFKENSTVTFNSNQANDYGGALYIESGSIVTFEGISTVTIINNIAIKSGGALYIQKNCSVTFKMNSTATISNNKAYNDGGALFIRSSYNFTFEGNSTVTFNNNSAIAGGALYIQHNNITFNGNSMVKIGNNLASGDGGALSIKDNSDVTFEGNSVVAINNNQAGGNGGAIYTMTNCNIAFEESSIVTINNNQARGNGGAIYTMTDCNITFEESSMVTINNNQADDNGGALYIGDNSDVTFKKYSRVKINNNQAIYYGGALHAWLNSNVVFRGNSTVTFDNNEVKNSGGAVHFRSDCNVLFQEDSFVEFYKNTASISGGALYGQDNCNVTFNGSTSAIFGNNEALDDGGALYSSSNSHITFQENSTVTFNSNRATNSGGALHFKDNSKIRFENNCIITFDHNKASQGGAIFTLSNAVFNENSKIKFDSNKATFGGALHISKFSITLKENTVVAFHNNEAVLNGGSLYSQFSSITLKQRCTMIFTGNSAENGGAAFISNSIVLISDYSNMTIKNNVAKEKGGAIYFNELIRAMFNDSSTISIIFNAALKYGGGIYCKITQKTKYFNLSESYFDNNTASISGNLLYIDVSKSCNASCLTDRVIGISSEHLQHSVTDKKVATSPRTLKLHYPAKCISNDSVECIKYYIDNIMLGQEIAIQMCLLDYYNKPAEATQFKVIGEDHQSYFVHGSEFTSISCNHTIGGISIIGNEPISDIPLNFSVLFTSYAIKSEQKIISVNLTVGLSPCHPGFQYTNKSQKCECYNKSGIVYCSGSSSTIKRGYWFGHLTGRPTVTFCPIHYCNFTCCKTTNGYYDLSPERINQCRSQRSGTACGSCKEGHTLSFDSPKCIDINKCFTSRTILVVALTVLYWFAMVAIVFIIMYYQVGIGYFYAITYYYSLVDVLLSQNIDVSNELYIMVTVMSSIAKITPRFLGQLCLFENMSGIDQQFIHYTHPLAILVILIIISWLARHFKRLSTFISRGIIHAICFLLLLSYTSVTTTSLLLMRSLTYADVDDVYTYLSPGIQYFHGRHLAYGVVAIILALLIVIGLPLLLLLEPFLNHKVNFIRIKPLLDQFQGCYKDKYHYFAAYYMICRLIIITIIIVNFSEAFISQYLLISVSTIFALIHLIVRPYADDILNIYDAAILHTMVAVTVLQMFEYLNAFDFSLVVGIAFVLVILPLVKFVVMKVFASKQILKDIIKNAITHFVFQDKTPENEPNNVIANISATHHGGLIIDDNMRRNATVCEIEHHLEIIGCRDPFMEVLKEIEDNNIL